MFKTHASQKFENKEVVAVSCNGLYTICAYVDGGLVGAFDTTDKDEAMEVYFHNCCMMNNK